MASYGPPALGLDIVQMLGPLELEYAAIRRTSALLDQPERGTIEIRGEDRRVFLNNMLTQELSRLEPLQSTSSFWLNRQGRIVADLRIVELGDRIVMDLDRVSVAQTVESLDAFVIADDVQITDVSEQVHRFALHGPQTLAILDAGCRADVAPSQALAKTGFASVVHIADAEVLLERVDTLGEIGVEISVALEQAATVHRFLLATFCDLREDFEWLGAGAESGQSPSLRPIGWHARNIARVEAGTPLFNIDFTGDNLPHETGVLDQRVSFRKGCFLGQEIVARMQSLGKPKQMLVGLLAGPDSPQDASGLTIQAPGGSRMLSDGEAKEVGAITSSVISPMLGSVPVYFAMVRTAQAEPGTTVHTEVEDKQLPLIVQPGLRFYSPPDASASDT